MQRLCVCGKPLNGRRHLCPECASIYGNRSDWPEWLRFWINDTEREIRYERKCSANEIQLDENEEVDNG